MTVGVKDQEAAEPDVKASSDKELNFRKLEEARLREREEKMRLEMQNETLQNELKEIKEYLKPKERDPFEDIDDYIEPEVKKALVDKFNRFGSSFERKAEEIAEKKYQEIQRQKEEAEKKNFLPKLQNEFNDFDQVMTEQNIMEIGEKDPTFLQTVLMVPDEYEKRKFLYQRIKANKSNAEPEKTVQDRVRQNQKNPYHVPSSASPTSDAIDFDLDSPGARESAYQKLRSAQRGK